MKNRQIISSLKGGKTTKFYQKKVLQQYDDIFVNEVFEKKDKNICKKIFFENEWTNYQIMMKL